ncbi:GNAT family N-acetyltransferase [Roseicyclus sp.]
MRIRQGQPAERAALETLAAAAFLDYVRGIGRDWPGPYDWLAERLAKGEVWVVESIGGPLLGMAALSQDTGARTLTVDLLAVAPAAQGQGIGHALLAHAEALARAAGARTMHLHTVAKYDRLVRLYEGAGFRVTHTGPRPKGDDGHPRAFLRKWLDEQETPA